MPSLGLHGIRVVNHAERTQAQREWVARFFEREVRPLLVPVGLDPAHPFPQVANKSLNFIVQLGGRNAFGRENTIAIVKVPRVLPRVIKLPENCCPKGEQHFVLLSSVIRAHLAELFPGRIVESFSQFRVTRDSELEVDEDDVRNLRQALRRGLTTRHYGRAIRLEVVNTCPEALWRLLLAQFDLPEAALHRVNGPVNLVRLNELIDQAMPIPQHGPVLRFAPYEASWPLRPPAAHRVRCSNGCAPTTCCCTIRSRASSRWWNSCARPSWIPTCWPSSRRSTAPVRNRC